MISPADVLPTPTVPDSRRLEVADGLRRLVADLFALYVKTKNYHWHMSGPHFSDYHLLLDEQAQQLLAAIDPVAERGRKLGYATLRSVGEVGRLQRIADDNTADVPPTTMLRNLLQDNQQLANTMRELHEQCDAAGDVATASILENYIDEAEGRSWFLAATTHPVH